LHNELHNFYSTPNIVGAHIKVDEMVGTRSTHRGNEKSNILVGKPEEKRLLERPRRRWEYNIKTDRREIVYEHVNWNHPQVRD
jgi:hypothetical protein